MDEDGGVLGMADVEEVVLAVAALDGYGCPRGLE
jgi:hypothetical protein